MININTGDHNDRPKNPMRESTPNGFQDWPDTGFYKWPTDNAQVSGWGADPPARHQCLGRTTTSSPPFSGWTATSVTVRQWDDEKLVFRISPFSPSTQFCIFQRAFFCLDCLSIYLTLGICLAGFGPPLS